MNSVVDYIILAIIFLIIIHIFMRTFSGSCTHSKEGMESNVQSETPILNKSEQHYNVQDNFDLFADMQKEEKTIEVKPVVSKVDINNLCPINKMNDETDRYIKEIVLGGKFLCDKQPEQIVKDIDEYQNEFLSFGDVVNRSSDEKVDTVDKINELYTSQNNEMSNLKGKRIADVFNDLTQNKCGETDKCLIKPIIDRQIRMGYYLEDSGAGKYYTNYNWKYENDNVNNGGKFYDNIEASDSNFQPALAWFSKK
jgi:hypothetical protein